MGGYESDRNQKITTLLRSKRTTIQENHIDPDLDTFEKYRDTPPISSAMLLQKYILFLAESGMYTTTLHHNTPLICIAIFCRSIRVKGCWNTPKPCDYSDGFRNAS